VIVFGVCVGDGTRFPLVAQPTIERVMRDGDVLLTDDGSDGICAAYNKFIERSVSLPECEAVVLLHDDVELIDRNFRAKVLAAVGEPGVGVVGVIGASGLQSAEWWTGRQRVGRVMEPRGPIVFQQAPCDVDVLDGLLLVLTPTVCRTMRFDSERLRHFHGYDIDICLQARKAGFRVVVAAIDVFHRTKGGYGDKAPFDEAAAVLGERWSEFIVPATTGEKLRRQAARNLRRTRRLAGKLRRCLRSRPSKASPNATSVANVSTQDEAAGTPDGICPVCQQLVPAPESPLPAIAACEKCGTGITYPPPTIDVTTDELFTNLYGGGRLARRETWLAEARQRMTWVQLYRPDGLVLDLGCATGEFVKVAAEAGYESHGIEASTWAAAAASDFVDNITMGFLVDWTLRFPGVRADVITLWHVLEHVPDPMSFLDEIRRALHSDGLLIGEVPNFASTLAQSDLRSWEDATLSDHWHHFTPTSLRSLFERVGYRVETIMPITKRNYLSSDGWLKYRNECIKRQLESPSEDFIRFVLRAS
jgi:SAM-dependent methyltransferase/GT2 family glycosyltransferase